MYLYEYQHAPSMLQAERPSFVGSDHGDEILTVLGFCFTTSHVTLLGKCNVKISGSIEHLISEQSLASWSEKGFTGLSLF